MRTLNINFWAGLMLAIVPMLGGTLLSAHAQGNCMTFAQARQSGMLAGVKLRPAAAVKKGVEARTGGKVVSFVICRPGPVYRLTVVRPSGNVVTLTEPAR